MLDILLVFIGIGLLAAGGEALIRGALALAGKLGISPLLSGLLIVGFGTSTPELVVSLDAVLNQRPDIAVGNVVGSNIGNILLILGVCAVITPMTVTPMVLRRDALVMVCATVLFLLLAAGGALGRLEALALLAVLAAYLAWAYRSEAAPDAPGAPAGALHRAEAQEITGLPASTPRMLAAVAGGLALLIAGSRVLITGAVGMAQHFGVSEAVIGLSMVAVGTSLPELTVGVMAALRRHADVAVGNILGSNIFNLLGILGISALVEPLVVNPRILAFDQWVMLGSAVLLAWFLRTGRRLSRPEGAVLLAIYLGYTAASLLLG